MFSLRPQNPNFTDIISESGKNCKRLIDSCGYGILPCEPEVGLKMKGREYWRKALRQIKDVRMLALAGMLCALRIVLESYLYIPLGPNLEFSLAFLPNALGAMVYGPIVALVSGAVTDVVSWLLVSKGPFFPLFTLLEMLSSFLYGLFLYEKKISFPRCALCKGLLNLICNVLLTSLFLSMMYGKAVTVYMAGRAVKNAALFLPEGLLLFLLLKAMQPRLNALAPGARRTKA